MPVFVFSRPDGSTVEEFFHQSELDIAPDLYREFVCDDGVVALRDFGAEHQRRPRAGHTWPMVCEAMAVAPEQIARAQGIDGCQYTPDGCPIITSQSHYRRVQKARGFIGRNEFY